MQQPRHLSHRRVYFPRLFLFPEQSIFCQLICVCVLCSRFDDRLAVCSSRYPPDWNWIVGVSWRTFRCITTRYFGNAVVIVITWSWTQIFVFAPAVFDCQATNGLLPKIKLSFDLEYIITQKNRLVKSANLPFCRFDKCFILWYNIYSCFYGCPFWAAFSVSRRL